MADAPRPAATREKGARCENCSRPVEVGQVVLPWKDVGDMHADCQQPWVLAFEPGEGDPEPMVLIGDPMGYAPLAQVIAATGVKAP